MFKTLRDLGHARRVANQHRVRAMELQEALERLLNDVDAGALTSYRRAGDASIEAARKVLGR